MPLQRDLKNWPRPALDLASMALKHHRKIYFFKSPKFSIRKCSSSGTPQYWQGVPLAVCYLPSLQPPYTESPALTLQVLRIEELTPTFFSKLEYWLLWWHPEYTSSSLSLQKMGHKVLLWIRDPRGHAPHPFGHKALSHHSDVYDLTWSWWLEGRVKLWADPSQGCQCSFWVSCGVWGAEEAWGGKYGSCNM